ncbi:MAG: DNA mismatch repair protein MutS, partial [Bacillota bacterium]
MTFQSILFEHPFVEKGTEENIGISDFITDLNLDQIINAITISKQDYNLEPFFSMPLSDVQAIHYRHEVFQDLENPSILQSIKIFSDGMRNLRDHLNQVEKLYYEMQKESWFLDAVDVYCRAVIELANDLGSFALKSRGLSSLREYLISYIESSQFLTLNSELDELKAELSSVKYLLLIQGNTIKVKTYNAESDYSADVEETFKKFQQSAAKDHSVKFSDRAEMNHVEAKILEFVAQLYPAIFRKLDGFCRKYINFIDDKIGTFDREVQFYIAYLDYLESFKFNGLKFCYPLISVSSKAVYAYESFDLALAGKLQNEDSPVICNDFFLKGKERIIIVSGPNQGGKTTFA